MTIVKAIITTLDNLDNLKDTLLILRQDKLISEIIVVNNGSIDDTKEWLSTQENLTVINRQNLGAGPGRNAGLDIAGDFDYVLLLDGGIRPLHLGVEKMLDYLENTIDADVIGVEIPDFRTDKNKSWRRWINKIEHTYVNTRLSHTAYCLARFKVFDGIRFCENGPFSEPGWGVDDDELMCQWLENNISTHVISCQCNHDKDCTGVHPYRHASGSFNRLYKETGVWPNQFGSVYEKRVVWLQQNWAKYSHGVQWGEPEEIIEIKCNGLESTILTIKANHDRLRLNRFDPPYDYLWHPYQIMVNNPTDDFLEWSQYRKLRQHHGNKIIIDGKIIERNSSNEKLWTGDFKVNL